MWGMMQGDGWGWGMGLGMLGGVVFWVLVIAGVVLAVRWLVERSGTRADTPAEILDRRFARGEIDADEYARMKRELAGGAR